MKHFIKPTIIMISVFAFINMLSLIVEQTKASPKGESLSSIICTRPQLSQLLQMRPVEQGKEKMDVKAQAPKKKVRSSVPHLLPLEEVAT